MNTIKIVKTYWQKRQFVNFPNELYKGCYQYVPAFFGDEMKIFSKKTNPYSDNTDEIFFLCYQGKKVVGRIGGIISHVDNEKTGQNKIRFTRFDFIDDVNVARLLFEAVEDYAKKNGIFQIHGPLGFNDQERTGLVIRGFEHRVTFISLYNYEYYIKIFEELGLEKEVDYVEYRIKLTKEIYPRIEKFANLAKKRYEFVDVAETMSTKSLLQKYGAKFFRLLDESYEHLHGYVKTDARTRNSLIKSFSVAVDKRFVSIIVDKDDNLVALALTFPEISKSLQKFGGKIHPLSILSILAETKKPRVLELGVVAVKPSMKNKGLNAIVIEKIYRNVIKADMEYCESNPELEDNTAVQTMWKDFERENHRNRRCYIKDIK